MMTPRKAAFAVPEETARSLALERGFQVMEILAEKDGLYALVKVPVEDLPNLKVLKTGRKEREAQREIQQRYRDKLKRKPRFAR
jgi:hypothetical protein